VLILRSSGVTNTIKIVPRHPDAFRDLIPVVEINSVQSPELGVFSGDEFEYCLIVLQHKVRGVFNLDRHCDTRFGGTWRFA
jgi:hypothetical protein